MDTLLSHRLDSTVGSLHLNDRNWPEDGAIQREGHRDGTGPARPDLLFLFAQEERPDSREARELVAGIDGLTVAIDRSVADPAADSVAPLWLGLQQHGLTFDCSGLAPGPAERMPPVRDWLGIAVDDRAERLRCVGLALGPHLRGGQTSPPILRGLLGLARQMADRFSACRGICWAASGTVTERTVFSEFVSRWEEGSVFPAQLVTSLAAGLGGGIESRGLAYFTGQELRIEPGAYSEEGQGALLALRLVSQLIYRGRLEAAEEAVAPDGSSIRLEPSPNGRFVRVWAG